MKAHGWGRIINISGLAARQAGSVIGSMRNVAVAAMTKNLADELGPLRHQCNGGPPGLTADGEDGGVIAACAGHGTAAEDEIERRMAEGNVVRRLIDAPKMANIVTFLATPKSGAITGDAIAVGGGAPRSIHY